MKTNKKRIDQLLVERKLTESREKAQRLILARKVKANGQFILKPGMKVKEGSKIEIEKGMEFVGKGALKLKSAYQKFKLDFKNKIVADVGASTGGFTDFALKRNAKKVYAVDVGYGQLDVRLRSNKKVINMERTDIRKVENFLEKVDIFLIDVSFVSLKRILPKIKELVEKQNHKAEIISLVKPQFEVGKEVADKFKGVIKDTKIQKKTLKDIARFSEKEGLAVISSCKAGVTGEKGNQEYFLYLRYPKKVVTFGVFDILHDGHKYFLEEAKKFGDLTVIVSDDEKVLKFKKRKPIHNFKERIDSLKKLGLKTVVEKENPWQNVLESQADIIILGYDQNWENEIKKEIKETGYLVKIIKIKKAHRPDILKSGILRKNLTK